MTTVDRLILWLAIATAAGWFVMIFALNAAAEDPEAVDTTRMLWVIRQMETGDTWAHHGGAYQFTEATWRDRTEIPYRFATNPAVGNTIARRHLEWIRGQLAQPTAGDLYLAWRYGVGGKPNADGTAAGSDLYSRAMNLYGDSGQLKHAAIP